MKTSITTLGIAALLSGVLLPWGASALTSESSASANTGGVRATGGTVIVTGSQEAEASIETRLESNGTADVRIRTTSDGVTVSTTTRTTVSPGTSLDISARAGKGTSSIDVRTERSASQHRTAAPVPSATSSVSGTTTDHLTELPIVKRPMVQRIADLLRRIMFFWR